MGICICHNTKNGLITSEVMLPEVINNTNNEKEQNESIKTIPRIVQEKKLQPISIYLNHAQKLLRNKP